MEVRRVEWMRVSEDGPEVPLQELQQEARAVNLRLILRATAEPVRVVAGGATRRPVHFIC